MNMSHISHENMEKNHEHHEHHDGHSDYCAQHCLSSADRISQTVQLSHKELKDYTSPILLFFEEKSVIVNSLSIQKVTHHSRP